MSNLNHNQDDQNTNFMSSASKNTPIKRKDEKSFMNSASKNTPIKRKEDEKSFMSSASKHTPMKRKKIEKKDEKFLNKNMLTPEICIEVSLYFNVNPTDQIHHVDNVASESDLDKSTSHVPQEETSYTSDNSVSYTGIAKVIYTAHIVRI
ncbi:13243_t:CDS:2 [Racocetra fulgida]|uniref:13243_t:CDS:1 n=1 Tax=Racocetra fulgida TaxID=60492 RepID=A0A9N9FM37_9GLOM|nr:13243_t:CDS:2 [Racocetra fulgida]